MRFRGKIGYEITQEFAPGVYKPVLTERFHKGEVIKNSRDWNENSMTTNDDLIIKNRIRIVADSFARTNLGNMRYVEYLGTKWKIKSADIEYPNIILTLGGVWNG